MERRFRCTGCGKCCHGWLPLTLEDAQRHAGRFPLAMSWTPVPFGTKAYALAERLGISIRLRDRRKIAVVIAPTSYLPQTFSCPELTAEGLCGIQADKPLRCRTMPFYPYREEKDQADLLVPGDGWACDISSAAPVVYRDKTIVDRGDFDRERKELLGQAPTMRTYANYVLKYMPWIVDSLGSVQPKPGNGVVTSLSSFLTAVPELDAEDWARRQLPLLEDLAAKTAGVPELAEYHRNYAGWAKEMTYLAGSRIAAPPPL
jgi:Fe-S-cluster containining protein